MKNKITLLSITIVIMAFIVVFGYTNARYYSTASLTGDLDYIKIIGKISLYHPEWIGGWENIDDGEGIFNIPQLPVEYSNIHYQVSNKIDNKINEEEVDYYIRIVAEDGTNDIPIQYDVHEYNNPSNVLNQEIGVGYGPFTLGANEEETKEFSIKANFNSTDIKYITKVQRLRVQMVRKRIDGTLKVIDEAPLNMNYSGSKANVTFAYYLYGTSVSIGPSQTLNIADNITIDFTNQELLEELGINLPSEYKFHDIRHNINNANEYSGTATQVKIPEGYFLSGYFVEVYLTSSTVVPIHLFYYDYQDYTIAENGNRLYKEIGISNRQTIVVDRGLSIDFTNEDQKKDLGIKFPTGYSFQGLNGDLIASNIYNQKYVNIPNTDTDLEHRIEVYMNPAGTSIVELTYYDTSIDSTKLIETQTIVGVGVGTTIDFKNPISLSNLGIILPTGYDFNKASSIDIDETGAYHSEFLIPYNGANKTYKINVILNKVISVITVPVKFYDSSGTLIRSTTVDMQSDGKYTFTTDICRSLCPELNTMTSFTIYIANQWGSTYDNVGNTANTSSVIVDYNATYTSWADFKLTDEGSYIYIKAWW